MHWNASAQRWKDVCSDVDYCASNPCKNGVCIDGVKGYTCDCTRTGFTGDQCEIPTICEKNQGVVDFECKWCTPGTASQGYYKASDGNVACEPIFCPKFSIGTDLSFGCTCENGYTGSIVPRRYDYHLWNSYGHGNNDYPSYPQRYNGYNKPSKSNAGKAYGGNEYGQTPTHYTGTCVPKKC